jgi:hypothetical protein
LNFHCHGWKERQMIHELEKGEGEAPSDCHDELPGDRALLDIIMGVVVIKYNTSCKHRYSRSNAYFYSHVAMFFILDKIKYDVIGVNDQTCKLNSSYLDQVF